MGGSIPDKLGEKMAIHRARFFARSAGAERVAANANAVATHSHRFLLHNVKQRTRLR
jgi:hypothetical protein